MAKKKYLFKVVIQDIMDNNHDFYAKGKDFHEAIEKVHARLKADEKEKPIMQQWGIKLVELVASEIL